MMKKLLSFTPALLGLLSFPALADIKTEADREALFEDIVAKTMMREAWSPVKNEKYGVTYPDAFEPFRQKFIDAKTDEELYYAITMLSNARHDRHLKVTPAEGGLAIDPRPMQIAPVQFMHDFSQDEPTFFVFDVATALANIDGGKKIQPGELVVEINGHSVAEYLEKTRPYHRASTEAGFLMRYAMSLNEKSSTLPAEFYADELTLTLKPKRGRKYSVSLPYLDSEDVSFRGIGAQRYDGFEKVLDFESFDFYRSTDGANQVLFDWYGFRDDIVHAMDEVVSYAKRENLLDHDVIWDGTFSRGGGRGAYAIQRLQPKPFKTTFGNLRISDITDDFIAERKSFFDQAKTMSDGSVELIDDGSWLIEWLLGDVTKGMEAGQAYTNNVPFKSAHAPEYSDGILYPAADHFTGDMVCWLSPRGGSHLDQFASIVADNDLCTILGMPAGGYSNTWEWTETLKWPGTSEPVVNYMWSIGHTIAPKGHIVEGDPSPVDEYIPLTRDNFETYYDILMDRSIEILSND
ncbi:hypothetical protein [Hyphococcus sp. DH-69]|uniref:hypothetical protein n=1 Tax=Hyphococcus formosus TaxID=3143534 RepID=UPI00398AB0C1